MMDVTELDRHCFGDGEDEMKKHVEALAWGVMEEGRANMEKILKAVEELKGNMQIVVSLLFEKGQGRCQKGSLLTRWYRRQRSRFSCALA
jgi:hypothetical protein